MKNIVITSLHMPPRYSGAGIRAYKYALTLFESNRLKFIVTKYPNGEQLLRYQEQNDVGTKLPKEMIKEIRYIELARSHNNFVKTIVFVLNHILIFLQFLIVYASKSIGVVHSFGGSDLVLVQNILTKTLGLKSINELTGITAIPGTKNTIKNVLINGLNKRIDRYGLLCADKIIALSPGLEREFEKYYGKLKKAEIIPNGVDVHRFKPVDVATKEIIRTKHGIKNSDFVILYAGALLPSKGVECFIEIINTIEVDDAREYTFVFVGENNRLPEEIELKHQLTRCAEGKEDIKILFPGYIHNVAEYFNISDLFILPSPAEGFPNVVIEAMACGLPVIMNRIEGITDFIIDDSIDGFIVDENNIYDYVKIIDTLIRNVDKRQEVSIAARMKVELQYSSEIIQNKYDILYDNMLKSE
jgi:glycosyltransferase involved in cell wall biosynthesis